MAAAAEQAAKGAPCIAAPRAFARNLSLPMNAAGIAAGRCRVGTEDAGILALFWQRLPEGLALSAASPHACRAAARPACAFPQASSQTPGLLGEWSAADRIEQRSARPPCA